MRGEAPISCVACRRTESPAQEDVRDRSAKRREDLRPVAADDEPPWRSQGGGKHSGLLNSSRWSWAKSRVRAYSIRHCWLRPCGVRGRPSHGRRRTERDAGSIAPQSTRRIKE